MVLWPGGAPAHERTGVGFDRQTQQATVTKVVNVSCASVNASGDAPTGDTSTAEGSSAQQQARGTCKRATIRVDTGSDKGRTFTEIVQPDQSRQLEQGEKVVVAYEPSAPKDLQYSVADVNRRIPMTVLALIFAAAVVVVGRLRGVMALVALAISFMVLNFFVLPAILQGSNPLVVAVVGSSAIMLIALYLCHGLSARTSVAVLGTLISLFLIGILGSLFIDWAALTGNTDDNTGLIHGLYPSIDMSGLLLAGIIIGSLGVLDDVTVTQTSAVWELHEANPSMGWRGLYRAASVSAATTSRPWSTRSSSPTPVPHSRCFCSSRSRRAAWAASPTANWSPRRSCARWWAPSAWSLPFPSPRSWRLWWSPPTGLPPGRHHSRRSRKRLPLPVPLLPLQGQRRPQVPPRPGAVAADDVSAETHTSTDTDAGFGADAEAHASTEADAGTHTGV